MKKKAVKQFFSFVLSAVMIVAGIPFTAAAADSAKEDELALYSQDLVDVGIYADVSTDYVSGWENKDGVNDVDFEPSSSNMGPGFGWGNWSQNVGSEHYLQYDWDAPVTANAFEVYWYDDGGGTRIPDTVKFEYLDGETWKPMAMVSNFSDILKLNQYNTIEVNPVTTTAIRFSMTVRDGAAANGVYRWKVNAPLTEESARYVLAREKERLSLSERMTSDTLLPTQLSNGVTVQWSEEHAAIALEGGKAVVTRGTTDVNGKLTAVLSLNGQQERKDFSVTVPKKADAIEGMLAKYDFSNLSGTLANASMITDVSGHDHDAVVRGNGISVADNTLTLPGGTGSYVELPQGMFDAQDQLTLSMWIKNDQGAMWTSAFFFGKDTTDYFMINPQNPASNAAKVCITWDGSQNEIGMAPGSDLSAGPYVGNAWTHYIIVIDEDNLTGYINGEKYASYPLPSSISDMGTGLSAFLGRSFYGDPYFKGQYRNISIYDKTITDEEAGRLYTEGLSEEEILTNAVQGLEIPEVKEGVLSSSLYESVTLKTQQLSGLVGITWKSSNEALISSKGIVTAPKENTKVTMTATVKVGEKSRNKTFDILVLSKDCATYSMTLDQNDTGVDISQQLFGLFYEDINSSADGGLSPELVKNNSFQNYADGSAPTNPADYGDQTSWKKYWTSSNSSGFTVERTNGLNENNKNYAKLTGNMTLSNVGFTTMWNNAKPSIPIEQNTKYDFSMWMKAETNYAGTITVQVVNEENQPITDVKTLQLKKDGQWNKISTVLTGNKKQTGKLLLTITGAAMSESICVDMVSLASQDTYGYGNKNYAYGAGLRKDLVETLKELKPSFIRFPGGCAIEGDYGPDSFYNWENSIGPLEERKAQASYWGDNTIGKNPDPEYGYMMSFELGYHEILTLCEDFGAEAFPIMSAGIYCQFANNAPAAKKGAELDPYAQYAIDLLNYCWGDPDSTDPEQAKWAKKRVQNGHEEPFDLNYIGIGNENWNTETVNYYENFTYIKEKVEAYKKAHYPDHELQLIFAYGPYYWNISVDEDAYTYVKREMPGEVLMDEHYYAGANWMLENTHRYDSYDRLNEDGTNVFVGEYAVNDKGNQLEGAIAEAAYMTGLERNADIVRHASYAPLLAKDGARNWSPNMIYFNEYEVMKTANYYVQWMYANNYGEKIVNTGLSQINTDGEYVEMDQMQTDIYHVSSKDENYIYLKLVNHDTYAKDIALDYPGIDAAEAEIISLSGDAKAENSFDNEIVSPKTTKAEIKDGTMIYQIPAMSLSVIKVAVGEGTPSDPVDKKDLQDEIKNAVSEEDQYKYTTESWEAYEAALKEAETVAEKKDATQKEVNDALQALQAARKALKEVVLPFVDVAKDDWFYDGVYYNYANHIVEGKDETHFAPYENLARAQFAVILHRIAGKPAAKGNASFPDVQSGQWYTDAVLWAADKEVGIIQGYTDSGLFGTADYITREQMAVMMYRYAEYKGYRLDADGNFDGFTDGGRVSGFAEKAMQWAVGNRIITGKDLNGDGTPETLEPQGNTSRAECAIIVQRFMQKIAE